MRFLALSFILSLVLTHAGVAEEVDLSRLDRDIKNEPTYKAEKPLFCLAVIGSKAQTQMWLVLDKSDSDATGYDVLYADLNGNRDLTEPNERIEGKTESGRMRFQLPDFTEPDTENTHTEFRVSVSNSRGGMHMIGMMWRGERKIGGGYPADPDKGYMQFAANPNDAPLVWLNGDGPFRFQRWYSSEFTIGADDDISLFIGLPGIGNSTFCAFTQYVIPEGEPVHGTLIYEDKEGNRQQSEFELVGRC